MVSEKNKPDAALARYRLGTVLVWLGVLTWLPFIVLRLAGEEPSFALFLPFHLLGVIGGSRLRSLARREMGLPAPEKKRLRVMGHVLIYAGVLVWAPYFYLKLVAQQAVEVMDYLPFHLVGVLGGLFCMALSYLLGRKGMIKKP